MRPSFAGNAFFLIRLGYRKPRWTRLRAITHGAINGNVVLAAVTLRRIPEFLASAGFFAFRMTVSHTNPVDFDPMQVAPQVFLQIVQ